jgi:hypothetical protein
MKNTIKLLGIIAFVAIIGFAFAACVGEPEEEEEGTLEGAVTITANEFGNFTTLELTATYDGTENVTYKWKNGETEVTGGSNGKLKPETAGTYTVSVSASGYKNTVESASGVLITAAPAYVGFLGRWKAAKGTNGASEDETFTIKEGTVRFDWAAATPQYYLFNVAASSGWTKIDTKPNWVPSSFTYDLCYKVAGTTSTTGGYLEQAQVTYINDNGIYFFLTADGVSVYKSMPDLAGGLTGSPNPRAYTKQ